MELVLFSRKIDTGWSRIDTTHNSTNGMVYSLISARVYFCLYVWSHLKYTTYLRKNNHTTCFTEGTRWYIHHILFVPLFILQELTVTTEKIVSIKFVFKVMEKAENPMDRYA